MKYKDFLSRLKDNGKINQAEFLTAIESAPDAEFPDKAFEAFETAFMTVDRAASHPEVNAKLRAELLDPIDATVKKWFDKDLKEFVDPANVHVINSEKNTYKKLEALAPMIQQAINKVKAVPNTDEETKKKLQTLEDTKKELMQKIEQMNSDYSAKENELKKNYTNELNDYKLNAELEKMSNGYILAEGYEETRPAITKVILADLRAKNSLSLGEKDGQSDVVVNDKEGKPKFNGNTPVTIKSLLDDAWKPFTKKNNGDSSNSNNHQDTSKRFSVDNQNNNNSQFRQGSRTTVQ